MGEIAITALREDLKTQAGFDLKRFHSAVLDGGRMPLTVLERRVRAMNPWPGAFFPLGPDNIRVLDAMAKPGTGAPGQQLSPGLIACGEGALRLLRLQRPGRAAMEADAFLRGTALPAQL
jgi:methionyl-tRNA formyltransferase